MNYKPASRDSRDSENVFLVLNEMVDTNSDCENAVLSTDGQGGAGHLHFSQEAGEAAQQEDVEKDARPEQEAAKVSTGRGR